jgi:hypothetical protein
MAGEPRARAEIPVSGTTRSKGFFVSIDAATGEFLYSVIEPH